MILFSKSATPLKGSNKSPKFSEFKEISPEIINGVDYVVNLHKDKVCKNPSTIIKLGLDSQVKVIRK